MTLKYYIGFQFKIVFVYINANLIKILRINLFIMYLSILSAGMPAGQKRAPDLITDGCDAVAGN